MHTELIEQINVVTGSGARDKSNSNPLLGSYCNSSEKSNR